MYQADLIAKRDVMTPDDTELLRFHELFDHSPSFVAVLWGPSHQFRYANAVYRQVVGGRQVVGTTVAQALPEVVEQGFIDLLDLVFTSGETHSARDVPILLDTGDGKEPQAQWLDFVYQPIRDADGTVKGIFVEGSDVSARHVSAKALERSEAFYRQVIDAATDYAIIALATDGAVTFWNQGAEKLLGWTALEMAGQGLERLFEDEATKDQFTQEMRQARARGHGLSEGWRLRRDGGRFWASGEMRPILDNEGAISGFVKVLRDRTDEHEASFALRRSEERLRRAQEAGHVGVFAIDVASGWLEPTAEACRIFGIAVTDGLPAEELEALVLPEDRTLASDQTRRASGDMMLDVEYRICRPSDGEVRFIARRAELERDASGKTVRMVGVVQDVTQQRAIQRAAQESAAEALAHGERVQLALAAGAIIGTWVWDIEADEFSIDDQFAEAFGIERIVDRSGIPLERITQTVHPDDQEGLSAAIAEVIARGGSYAHQYRVRRTDGRYYWIEANGRVERTGDGRLRFPGVLLDMEHRRSLEQDRDAAHRLLETVMEAVPGVVYAKDREGRMLMGNAGTAKLLGLAAEEFVGRTDFENLEDKDQARAVMANDQRIMDSGIGEQIVEHVHFADGQPAIWLSHKAPLRGDDGVVIGLIGASVDITDRVRAESKLRDLNNTLEQRIAHAIAEREEAEEALRQAQKMEAIGQLTGGIAHDFNNLLSIIMGSVELAARALEKSGNSDAKLHKMLGNAMVGANRAAALTQRLLAFSRRQPLAPKPVAIGALVESMRDLLERSIGETIQVTLDLDTNLSMVEIDANQLESALLNLAVNARDAMPSGGSLMIRAGDALVGETDPRPAPGMAAGTWVKIDVGDTGAGMPPEVLARAFEPFFTTKEQGKGTGLGLSMVYGFVRQSGGHVAIRSKVGLGTTVSIYLPRIIGQASGEIPSPPVRPSQLPKAATILVVEDDEGVRSYAVECLKEQGFTVLEAQDAPSALPILEREEQRIDLLLTDVIMPGPSGRELADRARLLRPDLKVLFMSGYPRDAIVHDGKLDAGVALLAKPFTFRALSEKLLETLGA